MQQPEWIYRPSEKGRNGTRVPLAEIFRYGAEEFPARAAIADGAASYTFEQLESGAQRIAGLLHESGVRPADKVAVLTSNLEQSTFLLTRRTLRQERSGSWASCVLLLFSATALTWPKSLILAQCWMLPHC